MVRRALVLLGQLEVSMPDIMLSRFHLREFGFVFSVLTKKERKKKNAVVVFT